MRIDGVLFDVDGTLVDTYRLYLESYRRALQPYLGYAPADEELLSHAPASERLFLRSIVDETALEECHDAMCRHYAELHGALCEGIYDGVREMLSHLRGALPVGVVTAKGRRAWNATAEHLDLGSFAVVVTEDDVREPKPAPEGLLLASRELAIEPDRLLYVGDSLVDLASGRAAGMRVGAALWPKTDPADRESFLRQIQGHEPDWLFERPADVSRALAPWC